MSSMPVRSVGFSPVQFQRAFDASESKQIKASEKNPQQLYAPKMKQTFREAIKSLLGLFKVASKVILHPVMVFKAITDPYSIFENLLIKGIPMKEPKYLPIMGGLHIIPFEQFDPRSNESSESSSNSKDNKSQIRNQCLSRGDSSHGMELKQSDGSPIIVNHLGKEGHLYWITGKQGRYDILQRLVGKLGPLGAVDFESHKKAKDLVEYPNFFFNEAIRGKRKEIVEIIYQNTRRIEKLLQSGRKVNLKEEWRQSIAETLFKCMIGDMSQERKNSIVNNLKTGFQHLVRMRTSPIPGITILSEKNKKGEAALKNLDAIGLQILSERLEKLARGEEAKDLFDKFAEAAVKLINEDPNHAEEIVFEASKIFFEMFAAGFFTRSQSRSNFDHLALTDKNFRSKLVQALDQFKSNNLEGIIQEALANEDLLKPFKAATSAALAYRPTVAVIARNSRVVFRELKKKSDQKSDRKTETIELTDKEVEKLKKENKLDHPLLKIGQKKEGIYPLGGYCRIALEEKENSFINPDGQLNCDAVFNPNNFEKITKIGSWQFGTGFRGCMGEPLAMETLTWDALCMAYLLKQFPNMKITGTVRTTCNIFIGKEFEVSVK